MSSTTRTVLPDVSRRTISPFDLSPSDNPGLILSQPLLRGHNYEEWSINIRHALKSRKKFGFVSGAIPQPDSSSSDFEDWKTNNSLTVSWIKNTLEPSLRSDVIHREFAKDLWDYLKRRFGMTSAPRLLRLRSDLANCRQQGLSVESYFGKLTKLWDDLASLRAVKVCKCGGCSCNVTAELEKQHQEDRLYEFLLGLDEAKFATVRSNLLSRLPLPTVEEAYLVVVQDEASKDSLSRSNNTPNVSAFTVNATAKPRASSAVKDKSVICTHCGRSGHAADSCFQLLGYPEWWGDRPRNRAGRGSGSSGGARGPGVGRSNATRTVSQPAASSSSVAVVDSDRPPSADLSDDQWKTLISLLAGKMGATETSSGPGFEDTDWSG
ncbi:PREDICTED: uncharacterized protein LOC104798893 [Tarenaya hassleriana]|uniref:uncharacterized protein LOC104798893 n=1 Tax=Tarenaya hassleriana TaxID=28532 RepID=UPI00053C4191|nr:PREDICTED: uncharacterized protein LOC104798893 [Tarenaya hassleriana]